MNTRDSERCMAKRLFFGLELPTIIREALSALDPQLKNARMIKAEQLHLTLSFLGNIEPHKEVALRDAVSAVNVRPFFLPVRGVGIFGGSKPSVLWAGVGSGHPHLFALYKHLQDAVLRAGLQPDLRAFHPHITLARLRDVSPQALRPFLRQHAESEFGMWEVKEFNLYSSLVSPEGSEYTVELRRPRMITCAVGSPSPSSRSSLRARPSPALLRP